MTSVRLFVAFLFATVGLGWALTIWWLANGAWRFIQWVRKVEG